MSLSESESFGPLSEYSNSTKKPLKTIEEVVEYIRQKCAPPGSVTQFEKDTGVGRSTSAAIIKGTRTPTLDTYDKLGFEAPSGVKHRYHYSDGRWRIFPREHPETVEEVRVALQAIVDQEDGETQNDKLIAFSNRHDIKTDHIRGILSGAPDANPGTKVRKIVYGPDGTARPKEPILRPRDEVLRETLAAAIRIAGTQRAWVNSGDRIEFVTESRVSRNLNGRSRGKELDLNMRAALAHMSADEVRAIAFAQIGEIKNRGLWAREHGVPEGRLKSFLEGEVEDDAEVRRALALDTPEEIEELLDEQELSPEGNTDSDECSDEPARDDPTTFRVILREKRDPLQEAIEATVPEPAPPVEPEVQVGIDKTEIVDPGEAEAREGFVEHHRDLPPVAVTVTPDGPQEIPGQIINWSADDLKPLPLDLDMTAAVALAESVGFRLWLKEDGSPAWEKPEWVKIDPRDEAHILRPIRERQGAVAEVLRERGATKERDASFDGPPHHDHDWHAPDPARRVVSAYALLSKARSLGIRIYLHEKEDGQFAPRMNFGGKKDRDEDLIRALREHEDEIRSLLLVEAPSPPPAPLEVNLAEVPPEDTDQAVKRLSQHLHEAARLMAKKAARGEPVPDAILGASYSEEVPKKGNILAELMVKVGWKRGK